MAEQLDQDAGREGVSIYLTNIERDELMHALDSLNDQGILSYRLWELLDIISA